MLHRVTALALCVAVLLLTGTILPAAGAAGAESAPVGETLIRGNSQYGFLYEGMIPSPAMGLTPPYRIYLPPGYDTSTERYPVLYLLHGNAYDIDYAEWSDNMKIDQTASTMINSGQIPPMIIVMPYGDHSYWMNVQGGLRWEDYMTQDVLGYIDGKYRTIPDRAHRAVGGNSMGGCAALHLAFNHQDLFGTVGSHSAALYTEPSPNVPVMADWNYYGHYDPLRLSETLPNLQSLQIWLDVGDQDPWRGNMGGLHDRLTARGIPHTWNMFPGPHDTPYWVAHSPDYLRFYASGFRNSTLTPTPTASPQPPATPTPTVAPDPSSPQSFEFRLGFKSLAGLVPDIVGQPLEDEHYGPNGDSLQQTSTGLMVWRKADNWTAFTNGSRTWINGPIGLQSRANDERFDWEATP